jgi:hypothetical protein
MPGFPLASLVVVRETGARVIVPEGAASYTYRSTSRD